VRVADFTALEAMASASGPAAGVAGAEAAVEATDVPFRRAA